MSKVTEINAETNEVIERELTDAELEQAAKDAIEREAIEAKKAAAEAAKSDLLAKLGITADEAKLLLG